MRTFAPDSVKVGFFTKLTHVTPRIFSIFNIQFTTMAKKQKIHMEVGKRYKGYGVLNEYGEYTFEPCQQMDEPQERMKILSAQGDTTIYESKNFFRVAVRIPKREAKDNYTFLIHMVSTEIMRAVYKLKQYI